MKYFFVLGTNTALSIAEIFAVSPWTGPSLLAGDFLVVQSEQEINVESLIRRLGGTIKIGRIVAEIKLTTDAKTDEARVEEKVREIAEAKQRLSQGGKFNFGLSEYGPRTFNKKFLGLKLKKDLSASGASVRLVVSRDKNLSSVIVAQNKLLSKGLEIVLAATDSEILIGETLTVQPFKDLSLRDYGRPARDDFSGMLPPKLAQIMLNLAQLSSEQAAIIDPFCGSGTILSEAILAGFKNLFGSDISLKAVEDTRKNISWTKELYKISDFKLKLLVKNVLDLSKFIKAQSLEAVITEPYLGPQRGQISFPTLIKDLDELYSQALKEFFKVLKPKGRVVMIWPLFYGQRPISPAYPGFKILNMLPESLAGSRFIKKNSRPTIIYGRPGQKVYREVVVLEKN